MPKYLLLGLGAIVAVVSVLTVPVGYFDRIAEVRHARRPEDIVNQLLELASVERSDLLYDLECGDGTLVVAAARKYSAHSVCLDTRASRISVAQAAAKAEHVQVLITFKQQSWSDVDLSPATVVVMFKTGQWHYSLRGQITKQVRPGTRIVSYQRDMGEWEPNKVLMLERTHTPIMLWIADGTYRQKDHFEVR
jgi:hypothetical protein